MAKYLKSKQEYIDLYDRLTVQDCRWRENFHKTSKPSEELAEKVSEKFYRGVSDIALHYDLLYATVRWHEDKEKTISEWMDRDQRKDEMYESAEAPESIRCLTCLSLTSPSSKMLFDGRDGEEHRVLFMYDCPNKCLPHRAFFDDGEEYKTKPHLCPKCSSVMARQDERVEDKKIVTTETCTSCGHVVTDELVLTEKKEEPDPDFEKDRQRFCLSGELLTKSLEEKSQLEGMARFMDEWKEKEKHKTEYDAIKNLKKLTVVALEQLLAPLCEENKYVKFQFGTPDMDRDLIVPFIVQEANPERTDLKSTHDLQKIIKKALSDTNWRLMTDGISYRMGILSGRLRAYEREEDLLKLVQKSVGK